MGTTAIKNTFSPALRLPCHLIIYPQTTVTGRAQPSGKQVTVDLDFNFQIHRHTQWIKFTWLTQPTDVLECGIT